jgi:peroxiredoxin
MKHIFISTAFIFTFTICFGQGLVKIGDKAPKYFFNKVVKLPFKELDIPDLKGKPVILAFWGTWCALCIPEMINLEKLQRKFRDKVQIIGVSDDNVQKLRTFLQKLPVKIWLASDPSNNLWNIFDFETARHIVLIDKINSVAAIAEMGIIDSRVINNLIASNQLNPSDDRGTKRLAENQDPVKLDSTTLYSFVLQPELKGITPMMKQPSIGTFGKRRITIISLVPEVILREAYGISLSQKIIYPTKEDSIKSNQSSYGVDFIVSESDKAGLKTLFQNELNKHLPVKAEIQKKNISCYVLRPLEGKQIIIKQSTKSGNELSFDGLGFECKGVPMKSFVSYLDNELNYPIYDATGLAKYYDIDFTRNNIEPLKSTKESLEKMGHELVKDHKEMDGLVTRKDRYIVQEADDLCGQGFLRQWKRCAKK